MANNPFDPPIVQVKKTLDRGGISTVNRGYGSLKSSQGKSRPAPAPDSALQEYPENLGDMSDVDVTTTPPSDGQVLTWDGSKWVPETVSGGGGGDGSGPPIGTGRVDSSTTPTSTTSTSNNEYTTRVKIKENFWLSSFSYYVSASTTPELIMRNAGMEILSRESLPVTTANGWVTHTLTNPIEVKKDEYYYFTLKTQIARPTWRVNGSLHQGPLWETNKVIVEDLFRGSTYDQTPGLRLTEYLG